MMKITLFLSLLGSSLAFQPLVAPMTLRRTGGAVTSLAMSDYLSSLSGVRGGGPATMPPPTMEPARAAPTELPGQEPITFSHAPLSYFALDLLTPKGPRAGADVGQPHDATRPLVKVGPTSAGSWWCAAGGWPSPNQRATTEVFYVFTGRGCLTDLDGQRHEFGPGDTVILPKGWSGRWDVFEAIHKVWVVHDHPNIEETANPIRAVITPLDSFADHNLAPLGVRSDAIHGSPSVAKRVVYHVGSTEVAGLSCTPGSFPVINQPKTNAFHVLEGVFFLTNADGSARRCVAGDTVVLPKGWTGHWDVIEPVKKLWVEVV